MALGPCFSKIDELRQVYALTYESRFFRVYHVNVYISYLTALFAIIVGSLVLRNLIRAKSGPIPLIVVSLQILSGFFVFSLAIIYTYRVCGGSLSIHQSLAIVESSFYGQLIVIVADYFVAMKYLHSSVTLTTQVDPRKFQIAVMSFLGLSLSVLLGYAIFFGVKMESFVAINPQVKDYIDIFCLIVENKYYQTLPLEKRQHQIEDQVYIISVFWTITIGAILFSLYKIKSQF